MHELIITYQKKQMKEKILRWAPRVLTILALLFMLMFSFDVFEENAPFSRKMLGFLIHNIPVLVLTVFLIIAWFQELIGGMLFILAFLIAAIVFKSFSGNPGSLIVIIPFLITGILFIFHNQLYGEHQQNKR